MTKITAVARRAKPPVLRGYATFLRELKARIQTARLAAASAVNRGLILLYLDIGRSIVEKQDQLGWGESVVERLANDLHAAFPDVQGFSTSNLWRMRQLHMVLSSPEFLAQAVREIPSAADDPAILAQAVRELAAAIPWGHHVELLNKIKSDPARMYYMRAAAQLGWSRNVLLNQIKARAYERARRQKKTHNFASVLPEHLAERADEMLKSSYNLEFLGIGEAVGERKLESRLIERLRDFILELGYGFCFVGQQYRLVLGKKEYFVDLLFYHRFLKALVAIELKISEFELEYAAKMDFYLNLLNEIERAPDDQPSIGIILCAHKYDLEVEYALRSTANPIGVAEYRLQPRLPGRLKGKLPSARQFADAVRDIFHERSKR